MRLTASIDVEVWSHLPGVAMKSTEEEIDAEIGENDTAETDDG